jgi:hypothetical protein
MTALILFLMGLLLFAGGIVLAFWEPVKPEPLNPPVPVTPEKSTVDEAFEGIAAQLEKEMLESIAIPPEQLPTPPPATEERKPVDEAAEFSDWADRQMGGDHIFQECRCLDCQDEEAEEDFKNYPEATFSYGYSANGETSEPEIHVTIHKNGNMTARSKTPRRRPYKKRAQKKTSKKKTVLKRDKKSKKVSKSRSTN